ncbi:NUDIX domain-containing protein [Agrococcus sp. SCSIO52902]|uniref:NUDIX domain-containing protein n=1 Tax=Agrococcus sp. SCSIO52902 TaxID=2933290 RepID=UPI001FF59C87|nr:NUDIX domain-containing protein [Agrococcus sp. SCSIO52902]UOW00663.1 NUDIX domain-containing protein [Agrococcus sp. SCSIO52902]
MRLQISGTHDGPRAIAVAAIRDAAGRLLVTSAGVDGRTYARPPGGGIDLGERAADAVVRELREELGLEAVEPRLLGVLESPLRLPQGLRHEIVFVFEVHVDAEAILPCTTDAGHPVWWLTAEHRADPDLTLVPEGLAELLGLD